MSDELKPCPFCGKSVAILSNTDELSGRPDISFMHTVVCNAHAGGCGSTVGYEVGQSDAIANWNRRALSARASAGEGGEWSLVPRKVTHAMLVAYWSYGSDEPLDESLLTDGDLGVFQGEWNDILAAAPQPQEAPAQATVKESLTVHPAHGDGEGE